MKGGGFLILLFLLICFLWGVTSVMGGISRIFSPKSDRDPHIGKRVVRRNLLPEAPMPEVTVSSASVTWEKNLDRTLAQLERINKLRNEGALTEEEFLQIKVKLIQESQSD